MSSNPTAGSHDAGSPLVTTDWLADRLGDPSVMVFETTVVLAPGEIRAGRAEFDEAHIPGSRFMDLTTELSDTASDLWFTAPAPGALQAALESRGVGDGTTVVFYDRRMNMWATRAWWLLRSIGVDAHVLDGGFAAWTHDGRPTTSEVDADPAPSQLTIAPRDGLFVDSDSVMSAVNAGDTCILNALSSAQHRGEDKAYGKAGHIPGAGNIPAADLVDPATHRYRDLDELRELFSAEADGSERIIAYCGGGIAATSDAFILTLLGRDDVAVYDGSLRDWIDRDLPLEV